MEHLKKIVVAQLVKKFPKSNVYQGALYLGVKRPGREADHSPLPSAEVKNAWSYTSIPPIYLHGVVPSWAQGQLYFHLMENKG
jgi:hypothetical protein